MDFPRFRDLFAEGRTEILTTPGQPFPAAVIDRGGSDVNVVLAASAAMADEVSRQGLGAFRALFVDTAAGQDLDTLAFDRFNLLRKPAAPSVGQVTFARPAPGGAGTIPAGFRVRVPGGTIFETVNATAFAGADTSKTQDVRSLTAGAGVDAAAAQITQFVDPPFDTTMTVTNTEATAGSADQEIDTAFRDRIRKFFNASRRGTLAALELGALSVPGVDKVTAIEITDPDGNPARLAEVFVADTNGNVNSALAAQVVTALLDFRAAGILVLVPLSTAQLVQIELALTFRAGLDTLQAEAAVRAAVVSFVNNLHPGDTLTVAGITATALSVNGVLNVQVVQPVGDLVPGTGQTIRTVFENVLVD